MADTQTSPNSAPNAIMIRPIWLLLMAAACALIGGFGGWLAATQFFHGSTERRIHDYIVSHGEVLPEAMENLRHKQDAKQLAGVRGEVEKPFPGSVLGNPQGKLILVEFTDFACTYCRRSLADVEQLIVAHPDLKVVVRQLPILSPESADAAKMGMAAAQQGKYPAFHHAMFEIGQPNATSITAAAQAAGLDMAKAKLALADSRFDAELTQNIEFARQLGFTGTPSWVAGDRLLSGAIGPDKLAEALLAKRD